MTFRFLLSFSAGKSSLLSPPPLLIFFFSFEHTYYFVRNLFPVSRLFTYSFPVLSEGPSVKLESLFLRDLMLKTHILTQNNSRGRFKNKEGRQIL